MSRKAEECDDVLQKLNEQMLKRGQDLKNKDIDYSHLETCVAKTSHRIKQMNEMVNEEVNRLC